MSEISSGEEHFPGGITDIIEYVLEVGHITWEYNGIRYAIASGRDIDGKRTWDFQYEDKNIRDFIFPDYGHFYSLEEALKAKLVDGKSVIDLLPFADFSSN